MTSPPERVQVECPRCGETYETWWRASINVSLEPWTEDELREATTGTCPVCGLVVELGETLIVSMGDDDRREER